MQAELPSCARAPARRRCFVPGAGGLRGGGAGLRAARRGPSRCLEHAAAGRRQRIGSGSLVARVPGSCWTNWWRRRWRATRTWRSRASACCRRAPSVTRPPAAWGPRRARAPRRLLRARPRPCAIRRAWAKPGPIDWHWMPAGRSTCSVVAAARWRPPMREAQAEERAGRCASSAGRAGLQLRGAALGPGAAADRARHGGLAGNRAAAGADALRARPGLGRGGGPGARGAGTGAGPPAGAAQRAGSAGACDRRVDGRLSRRTEGRAGARSGAHARAAAPAVRPAFRDAAQPARHTGLGAPAGRRHARVGVAVAERFPRFVIPAGPGQRGQSGQ